MLRATVDPKASAAAALPPVAVVPVEVAGKWLMGDGPARNLHGVQIAVCGH
jgi:hypothetical protein